MAEKKPSTLLIFVQDETGSMDSIREQTISAFNEYFQTLKADTKGFGKLVLHLWQFSEAPGEERVRDFYRGSLKTSPALSQENYRPRGVTPLFDAVGTAIKQAEGVKADRYLFIVQTDGLENASKDFTREEVQKIVSDKEADDKWTLVFLGAGISQWVKEAVAMGAVASSSVSGSRGSSGPLGAVGSAALASASLDYLHSSSHSVKHMASRVQASVDEAEKAGKEKHGKPE